MTTLSIQRTVAGVLTSADTANLTVTSSTGTVVVNDVLVAESSEGIYSYDTGYLVPGQYNAEWTFVVAGQTDDVVSRVFEADAPTSLVAGVTLAAIERATARRVGPFYYFKGGDTSTEQSLYIARIKSRIDTGTYENLYILRRGVMWDGSLIEDFPENDRVRSVDVYDAAAGTLTPDADWESAPLLNEAIELHYLDPEQELRPAVQAGLARCYFWDTLTIETTSVLREVPISASFPWLTNPSLIANIESAIPGSRIPATNVLWWKPFYSEGSLKTSTEYLGPGSIYITALRPHSTYVNGELSQVGPNSDSDVLAVHPEYAVRAAHVQCWLDYTDRLTPLAAQGLRLTSAQVAAAFSQWSLGIVNQQPDSFRIRFDQTEVLSQVGNAAEEV